MEPLPEWKSESMGGSAQKGRLVPFGFFMPFFSVGTSSGEFRNAVKTT
jgi:apolipoprotein N-acyltransferase